MIMKMETFDYEWSATECFVHFCALITQRLEKMAQ